MKNLAYLTASACAATAVFATSVIAQSTGASPADPNNERNQRPAMSNSQPADPATDNPAARIPTDPEDALSAENEEGGSDGIPDSATGASAGETGSDYPATNTGPAAAP